MSRTTAVFVAATAATLTACSSSSDDTPETISALTAPTGVSVVEADDSDVSTGGTLPGAGSLFPTDSDYITDSASIQLFDPSIRAVQTANQILCEVGFSRFWQFVNQGPYDSQVDSRLCGNQPDSDEANDLSKIIHLFTLDSTRASNSAPQLVQLWLDLSEEGTPITIHGNVTVTEAPSETDRFGAFELVYAGVPSGVALADAPMFGRLASESGDEGFTFMEGFGDTTVAAGVGEEATLVQVAVQRDTQTGAGAAKVTLTRRFNEGAGDMTETQNWRVVFDDTHMIRQLDSDPAVVLGRGDYNNHVYAYNIYEATGADAGDRIELFAGTNVEFANGDYGWIGYHGAWAPDGSGFVDGETVTSNDGNSSYTVRTAPGRLLRRVRSEILLTEIVGQTFEWWDANSVGFFQVGYNGTVWQRTAMWNDVNLTWDPVNPATTIDTSVEGSLDLHSNFLGNVRFVDGDLGVTYFESELVDGSDAVFTGLTELEFFARIGGLKAEIDQTDADAGDVHLATAGSGSAAHRYVMNPTDMTLMLDVNGDGSLMQQVGLANGVEPTTGPNTWGMRSGPMLLSAAASGITDPYAYFDETEHYVYETGHNQWNQYIGLVDAMGEYVTFDKPIEILYVHSTANDMNADGTFDGQQILLQYNGPGKLFGIPGEEVDLGGGESRYVPAFSIADGTVLGATSEYILRAIGVEQTLAEDLGGAPQLDITDADTLTVPALSSYQTPNVGTRPEVNGPPAVIDGEIQ